MIKSVHKNLLTIMTAIFLCMTQSTECLDYKPIPSHEAPIHEDETTQEKTSITAEEVETHNQSVATAVNKFLPDTAKQPVVNNQAKTPDAMGGGLDLGAPHTPLDNDHLQHSQQEETTNFRAEFINNTASNPKYGIDVDTRNDGSDTYSMSSTGRNNNIRKTTLIDNATNKPTTVIESLPDTNKTTVTTKLDSKTGKKVSTTISTPPVKTGWFSTTHSSTVIHHHDDGTHTAVTTTTTSGLFGFGKKSQVTVEQLNNKATTTSQDKFTLGTSRNWDGSTTTTTKHEDGSISTKVNSLFGSPISSSGIDAKGQPIDFSGALNPQEPQ